MSELVDVSPLAGRGFVTSEDNSCIISILGPGGVRIKWKVWPPSERDKAELQVWIDSIIGKAEATTVMTGRDYTKESTAYHKFLQERKDK